jgi:hypothetical protein
LNDFYLQNKIETLINTKEKLYSGMKCNKHNFFIQYIISEGFFLEKQGVTKRVRVVCFHVRSFEGGSPRLCQLRTASVGPCGTSMDYCWGLVPRVPRVTGYSPTIWLRPVPTSSKWLGNHTSHTGYGPTTPG